MNRKLTEEELASIALYATSLEYAYEITVATCLDKRKELEELDIQTRASFDMAYSNFHSELYHLLGKEEMRVVMDLSLSINQKFYSEEDFTDNDSEVFESAQSIIAYVVQKKLMTVPHCSFESFMEPVKKLDSYIEHLNDCFSPLRNYRK